MFYMFFVCVNINKKILIKKFLQIVSENRLIFLTVTLKFFDQDHLFLPSW